MSRWVYLSSLKTVEASLVLGAYSPLSLSSPLWSKVFFQNHESVKNEKRPFLKKGTYLLCYLQICKAPNLKSDILLNRGCKQKQIIKFKALYLQGEEELKGAFAFLLFYVALRLIPADPHGPVLDTTCGLVPGRLRDCDLLPAEQGPSFFPLKNCTSFIQALTKLTLASTLALVPRENRHNLPLNSCWFAVQVERSVSHRLCLWKRTCHLQSQSHSPALRMTGITSDCS